MSNAHFANVATSTRPVRSGERIWLQGYGGGRLTEAPCDGVEVTLRDGETVFVPGEMAVAETTPRMPCAYVAGPFTAETPDGVTANVMIAERIGRMVADLGASPVVPHSFGLSAQNTRDYDWWIRATESLLLRCDAVIMAPGWENSVGAMSEWNAARRAGIPTFTRIEDLGRWVAERSEG